MKHEVIKEIVCKIYNYMMKLANGKFLILLFILVLKKHFKLIKIYTKYE